MAYLDELQPLNFGGISFPYERLLIRGVLRDHVHEIPHVHGGGAEKQGRKLYEVEVSSKFDEKIGRAGGRFHNRNLLLDLNVLMGFFEAGDTLPLYVPNVGEIQAYCRNWTRELTVRIRSGEKVDLVFREDQESDFLVLTALSLSAGAMASSLQQLESLEPTPSPSIFSKIRAGINSILAIRDQGLMWAGFVEDKIEGLRALFQEADETLDLFNDPENWPLLEELKRLWAAMEDFGENLYGVGAFDDFVTPSEMTSEEASNAIYGDSAHAIDIANWNAIADVYRIPAGTKLQYIPGA